MAKGGIMFDPKKEDPRKNEDETAKEQGNTGEDTADTGGAGYGDDKK